VARYQNVAGGLFEGDKIVLLPWRSQSGLPLSTSAQILERFLHLCPLNRGVLLTPFHNMPLTSPAATEPDIDAQTKIFASATSELTS
jgi:glutamate-1-semialdehyde aminotransferase